MSILLNKEHNSYADIFFKYLTHLGGTVPMIIITGILLFIRFSYAIVFFINTTIVFFLTIGLKMIFDTERPLLYFGENDELHYVSGVTILKDFSFPSGHTSNAFCMYLTLAFFVSNHFVKGLLCVTAILVGISRVYLLQHFLVDIFFGALIAIVVTHALMMFYEKKTMLFSHKKLQSSLLRS
ncbi:MAG: phosphatase PAP2 family protein [Chitinophagales bacterium]